MSIIANIVDCVKYVVFLLASIAHRDTNHIVIATYKNNIGYHIRCLHIAL